MKLTDEHIELFKECATEFVLKNEDLSIRFFEFLRNKLEELKNIEKVIE